MPGDVDVVVVAYGAPGLLDRCLTALGPELPVTVIDNSSDPDVRSVADRHSAVYVDPGRNLGFAGGVNLGLDRCRPSADVLLLNPDAAIEAAGVEDLVRCLHARPDRACVAPAQVEPATGQSARVSWPLPTPCGAWVEAVGLGRLRRGPRFMIGSVLLLRRAALTEVGRFDERFFLYAEETDWQHRAHDRGWTSSLCPEVAATHVGAGTGGDATEREVHFHASNERYIRKHHGSAGWLVFRAGVMTGALVRAVFVPGDRGRRAADQFHLYRRGPCRAEADLRRTADGDRRAH
ncbi:MAG: glycosyltransferase family 2 protein [Acidimicrobiales bacterium]